MQDAVASLTIGALANAAAVNVETIRFYQRRGLLAEPDRPFSGSRRYGEGHVMRVRFIKAAQRLGFTLDEVAELLELQDGIHCAEARRLAERRLQDVRERLASLRRVESALRQVVGRCSAARSASNCPLIASLWDSAIELRVST
jgi:MerR family mercuric resistance operon transcriptional regulator